MDITIGTQVTPTFTQIGPLCQNSTAPALPQHQTMALQEHGTLQRSVQQQLEQLPIHLHQQIHVLQWHNGYHDQQPGNTNVHTDRTTLSEQYCTSIPQHQTMALQEHGALQRSVRQQLEQRPIHLHQQIHVLRRDNGYYDRNADSTNVHTDRTTLPE
jgi:septation ring formation regulator EzrA